MPGITGADSLGRYHSVTRQLLRKADGVVLMYDVTSQESFVHVRYWLDCLRVSCRLLGLAPVCSQEGTCVFPTPFLSQDCQGHNGHVGDNLLRACGWMGWERSSTKKPQPHSTVSKTNCFLFPSCDHFSPMHQSSVIHS